MKIIYTNISPVTSAYTNLNHIFYLKKQNPQKAYICVWDNFVFENDLFEKGLDVTKNKADKLKENVDILEKLMTYLKIDYKIIYLSEAMKRLLRNSHHLKELQQILAHIRIEDLTRGFHLEYIPFKDMTVSKINYIIADHLIATYLPELFPEICSSQPTHYLTSERFKVFQNTVSHCLKTSFAKYVSPQCIFVTKVPVVDHPEKKIIPSLEMSLESIRGIVNAHYKEMPESREIYDLGEIFLTVLSKLSYKDEKIAGKKLSEIAEKINYKDFLDFVSVNLYDYFNEINKITSKIKISKKKKSHFISDYTEFNDKIKSLNYIKLEILRHCNGNNSSLDIARNTGIKLSTVSTYLTHLKNKKIIDIARKPKRMIDSFVIDLEVLEK